MSLVECPRCKSQVESLVTVDTGFRNRLNLSGHQQVTPDKVCSQCYQELGMLVSSPTNLLTAKDKMKESAKINLWKSRVNLVRKARMLMKRKAYGDAVVAYEKYLKILELVFGTRADDLAPEIFKEHAATKELTVLTSVYWDLVRIYDTNEKYKPRMIQMSQKLALFASFTPMHLDIIKQAEAYKRKAKNVDVINKLLKQLTKQRNRCFIATSAFESAFCFEVLYLTHFRDLVLQKYTLGRAFIRCYYFFSPPFAQFLDKCSFFKPCVRSILRFLIFCISKFLSKNLPSDYDSNNLVK